MERTAETFARELAGAAAATATNDWLWTVFGFRGCPKRGAIFNRWIPRDRLERETFLLREFIVASTAVYAVATPVIENSCTHRRLAARMVEVLLAAQDIPSALRFRGSEEAFECLTAGVAQYLSTDRNSYASVFLARAQKSLGQRFQPAWLVALARFFAEPGSPLETVEAYVRRELPQPLLGDVLLADERIEEAISHLDRG